MPLARGGSDRRWFRRWRSGERQLHPGAPEYPPDQPSATRSAGSAVRRSVIGRERECLDLRMIATGCGGTFAVPAGACPLKLVTRRHVLSLTHIEEVAPWRPMPERIGTRCADEISMGGVAVVRRQGDTDLERMAGRRRPRPRTALPRVPARPHGRGAGGCRSRAGLLPQFPSRGPGRVAGPHRRAPLGGSRPIANAPTWSC